MSDSTIKTMAGNPAALAPSLESMTQTIGSKSSFNFFTRGSEVKLGLEPTSMTYDLTPIDMFGKKMLMSMGWHEGRGVGKNTKNAMMEPVEFIPRPLRMGLGAQPKPLPPHKKDKRNRDREDVSKYEESKLGSKNVRTIGEKMKEKKSISKGDEVAVIRGKHKGMCAVVVAREGSEVNLEFMVNGMRVCVDVKDCAHYEDKLKYDMLKQKQDGEKKTSKKIKVDKETKKLKWILPDIMVRIVSKKYKEGRFYNRKVSVIDVPTEREFSVSTSDGLVLTDLKEKYLETVVPSVGGDVIVLRGEHKGKQGRLLSKDKRKNKCQVQLKYEIADILSLRLDDCASIASSAA